MIPRDICARDVCNTATNQLSKTATSLLSKTATS